MSCEAVVLDNCLLRFDSLHFSVLYDQGCRNLPEPSGGVSAKFQAVSKRCGWVRKRWRMDPTVALIIIVTIVVALACWAEQGESDREW